MRITESPAPRQLPAARRGSSGCTRGTTTSGSVAVNERPTSHMPNGSVSRSRTGPISQRPRTSLRNVYDTAARRPGSSRSTTNRGRAPST